MRTNFASFSPVAARWTVGFAVSSLAWGVAFGVAATAKMSVGLATTMSALVFSGTAQLMAIELWTSPLPVATILLPAFSINVRYLAMSATLAPLYEGRRGRGLVATALLSDASWAIALRAKREGHDPDAALITSNAMMWATWVTGTLLGGLVGYMFPDMIVGLLGWLVVALLGTLLPSLAARLNDWVAVAVAVRAAVMLDPLLSGSWHILAAGLLGAVTGYVVRGRDA
jgi:predicted branched-subunit amino acid permease